MAEVAGGHAGRISAQELLHIGAGRATIADWVRSGYLYWVAPGVYAVGHLAPSVEADLWTAVLYAGPGAGIGHGTAAWWYEWLKDPMPYIQVVTPRDRASRPQQQITVHARKHRELTTHKGIPITSHRQTLLDLAAIGQILWARIGLANLDFHGQLNLGEIAAICGRGRKGSRQLLDAIKRHMPELARTRSHLEIMFLLFCERYGIPIPLVNRKLHGVRADFWWPEFNLVVFTDGMDGHRSPERVQKDHAEALTLRQKGNTVVRYTEWQIKGQPLIIEADLRSQMH